MAITQERIISVISALRRAYDTSNTIKHQIRALASSLTSISTVDDYRDTLQSMQFLADQSFISEADFALLIAEEQHFKTAFKKNQRTAAYARRKRAGLSAGLTFTGGNAPASISSIPNISDEEKYAHYENAERAISAGLSAPDQNSALDGKKAPTSPHSLVLKKPLDLYTTKKPLRSGGRELSADEMQSKGWLSQLAKDKMEQDAKRKAVNIPPLYPDFTDDSVPLCQEDQIALGYLNPADISEELF